jgi:hypothetical protein
MGLNRRKLTIGLVALGILVLVYFAYTRLGGATRVDLGTGDAFLDAIPTDNADPFDSNTPMIGGVQVGAVLQTEFVHIGANGVPDRKFGFDTLLHKEGDLWETTEPYYSLFMPSFRCDITADRGEVQCEMALGQPIPKDAMLSGNVVIHVIPNDPNDLKEAFIYLEDLAFFADRSLFSTANSVKIVSRSTQLVGQGMELVYDPGRDRLQLFRINDLESWRLRSADLGRLTNVSRPEKTPAAGPVQMIDANAVALDAGTPTELAPALYECVFWKNVRIDAPEQIIIARQRLAVNNILWSDSDATAPGEVPTAAGSGGNAAAPREPNGADEPAAVPYPGPKALDTRPSRFLALSSVPEASFDILVTCDGGFVVGPRGIGADAPAPNGPVASLPPAAADPNHQTVSAERIDVDAGTSDVALAGPVHIGFTLDPNNLTASGAENELMPVTITAQRAVTFLAATDQIRLEGDCVVTLQSAKGDVTYDYALTAPVLLLDIAEDPNATGGQITLRHAGAEGGPISVRGRRYVCDEPAGWVRLDGSRLDYDAVDANFLVTGPGTISIHNTALAEPAGSGSEVDPNEFSLRQPCYARMSGFDLLTYSASAQRIVAESAGRIQLGYVPILAGGYGPAVNADAGHIEIQLRQTSDGQMELVMLTASRGITYEDETQHFAGSTLTYDYARNFVRVTGDADQPCYLNGALVDQIEMDVSTRNLKGKFQAPSTLPMK